MCACGPSTCASSSPEVSAEDRGFIRVGREEPPLWMRCDRCARCDAFQLRWEPGRDAVECACGARYGHAMRPDGRRAELAELRFTPFAEGPIELATLEWDATAIALTAITLLGVTGILAYGWWT